MNEHQRANTHETGMQYEKLASDYLCSLGYSILDRNWRFHRNEIDLIARDGPTLVFVEVKARLDKTYGYGMQAVDFKKQKSIRKVAEAYLLQHHYPFYDTPCRFDVISIDNHEVRLFRNAF